MKKKILITGIGCPGGVSIIQHIKSNIDCEIIGVDSNIEYCSAKKYVDVYYQVPKAEDKNFLKRIYYIIKKHSITNLISLVTSELNVFSSVKKQLNEKNVKIYISDENSIIVSSNKYLLYERLQKVINLPKYIKTDIRNVISNLNEFNYPKNEVCFKPLNFDGARGFRVISESNDRLKSVLTEKPYNFYITVDELRLLLKKSEFNCDVILSEYLPGKEYTVDTFVENGKIKSFTIRERLKLKDHISFVGKTTKNKLIEEQIFKINDCFKFEGSIGYQFKEINKNIPLLLECNPRLQGATILSCKDNFDYILANIGISLFRESKEILMMRYFGEVYESNKKFIE